MFTTMDAGRNLLSSPSPFPPRTHLKNCLPSSSAAAALTPMPSTSIARHFPTSVLIQEQRDESRPLLQTVKEDRTSQAILDKREMVTQFSTQEEYDTVDSDQYLKDFQCQLFHWPGLWHLSPLLQTGERRCSLTMQSEPCKTEKLMDVEPCDVVALARKALSASKQAASLTEESKLFGANLDESLTQIMGSTGLAKFPVEEVKTVRSTRLLERRFKQRRVPKPKVTVEESSSSKRAGLQRKTIETFNPDDPLRLFLWAPETRQLLTAKEESELLAQIQDLRRLEEVKSRLQSQFDRDPTLVEWAEAVGLSCHSLQLQLHSGKSSREKLIYANFRLVVYLAKQYHGRGLSFQDLLQEGSLGLMRSVEKFKPQAGCRFATYAYWWIRQAVRKAIFKHSRTIRLPDNVYSLLYKVTEAKRLCIQEGHRHPTKERIAAHVGITVEKLEILLFSTRMPTSMQQRIWTDQDTTFQEITADTSIETPDVSVAKQLMRQHVRGLLSILNPKERKIIRLRYGIEDGKQKSLSEIGAVFGLSKERIRQLESQALYKLKQCLGSHGLDAYSDMLI